MDIEIKIIKEAEANELVALYRGAGWWDEKTDDISFLDSLIKNSYAFAGVFYNRRMIGMGRAISDGVSDAYIQDVTVLPEYRNRGIGGMIIKSLVKHLLDNDMKWIGLIGEPGTKSFYERLGFREMKEYIPMLLKERTSDETENK